VVPSPDAKTPGGGTYIGRNAAITSPAAEGIDVEKEIPARYGGPGREAWGACYAWRSRSVSSAPTSTKSLSPPSETMA
jgi:hypothetical protein